MLRKKLSALLLSRPANAGAFTFLLLPFELAPMPKIPFWIFIITGILYFTAVRVDTMDVDASQYAEMSREMMRSGDYLHLYDRGHDYLDKPNFLFWVSAGSMKVFGVNDFAYKLPSILFALLAIFSTYKLAKLLYGEATGRMAALILASCQGLFLMTNDVRCDTILMSWVITAVWLIQEWLLSRQLKYLLLGAAAIAFGMMTKGPIALMVPVFCFISDWALKREWKNFFKAAYIPAIIVIAILLIPMSIGLYQQFDMHPEKIMDGKAHVSGLRFFYWSQSFGRITGESPWKNGADISFLLVNMLWSFLPWIFLFIAALITNIVTVVKQKFRLTPQQEWVSTGGFLLAYLALGSSKYQLPHYIFVAFPLAAIVVAGFLKDLLENAKYPKLYRFMNGLQVGIVTLLFLTTLLLITYVFPAGPIVIIAWVVCAALLLYVAFNKAIKGKILWLSAACIIMVNIFLTNHVYYNLLKYEVGTQVGRYVYNHNIPADNMMAYKMHDPLNSLDFYAQRVIEFTDTLPKTAGRQYILTMDNGLDTFKQHGHTYDILDKGKFYKVSELTPQFLNPNTRDSAISNYYLIKLKD